MNMCAIAGVLGEVPSRETLETMLATMKRRGPDGKGTYQGENCTLLHTRLAVIDPEGGAQPMELWHMGRRYILTYNGEIYNTQELRLELISLGHCFEGHSDTEVLLHALAQWGEAALDRLNGIYAFALWQPDKRELFMARDRMGVKPLFYTQQNGRLVFASEIKTLLSVPGIEAKLDREGTYELLLLGPGRCPGSGVLRDIKELEPGCCARYRDGKLSLRRYWQLWDAPHLDSFPETVEKVRFLVKDAIRRQMVSDVPIGTFLSGGLDSSIITALCARDAAEPLDSFSVDYQDNDKYFVPGKFQPNSDNGYINRMCQAVKTRHHWTVLTPEQLEGALEKATEARDLPGMADVDFSLFVFCGEIRKHVKVALSGECADEIFGGYPWFRDPEVRAQEGFPWAQNTAYRASFLLDAQDGPQQFVRDCYLKTVRQADVLPGTGQDEKRMKEMVCLNMRWFMQTLLDRKDRMSMYHGLEVRVPFCDHRIAQYLYTVPWEMKDWQGKEKGLLRTAMEGLLPPEVLWRKKSPYPKTYDPEYTRLMENSLRRILENPESPIFGLLRREALENLLVAEQLWPWYGQLMRRPQTIAYMVQLNYWLELYGIKIL